MPPKTTLPTSPTNCYTKRLPPRAMVMRHHSNTHHATPHPWKHTTRSHTRQHHHPPTNAQPTPSPSAMAHNRHPPPNYGTYNASTPTLSQYHLSQFLNITHMSAFYKQNPSPGDHHSPPHTNNPKTTQPTPPTHPHPRQHQKPLTTSLHFPNTYNTLPSLLRHKKTMHKTNQQPQHPQNNPPRNNHISLTTVNGSNEPHSPNDEKLTEPNYIPNTTYAP